VVTAITGGIAEGKSTVLSVLSELGFRTASADDIARQVFFDVDINRKLSEIFGLSGPIEPAQLRDGLAAGDSVRRAVNRVMHPRIVDMISNSRSDFVEVPLLIETCLQGSFQEVWVVTCGAAEQQRRLRLRYGEEFNQDVFLGAQLPTEAKLPFSDVLIRTNQPLEAVRRSISEALEGRFA